MDKEKEYIATIQLGKETDTLDLTGKIVKTSNLPSLSEKNILAVLKNFIGSIKQVPPMYSALKVNGQPLYKLARKGLTITRKKRYIKIYDIKLQSFTTEIIRIKIKCGRGTYIRSLGRDIAGKIGTVAHLKSLKRTRIGDYDKKATISIKEFPKWLSAKL